MGIYITGYEAICNLGFGIDEIYQNALFCNNEKFTVTDEIINKKIRAAFVCENLPPIEDEIYNTRTNRLILACLNRLEDKISNLIKKYGRDEIAIVCATTNTGVSEFETTKNDNHFEIGNPCKFVKNYLKTNNFTTSVSTACSSGIKAFLIAKDIIETKLARAAIVIGADSMSKLPLYGFDSLEVLSFEPTIPFSANRSGINIGEGAALFIVEEEQKGIGILGIGETTDIYHNTCPDPSAKEAIRAINLALDKAKINPFCIDYINLHGTGTVSNDLMEAYAMHSIFQNKVKASSTKPLTGHCLGAASSIEIALCSKLIEQNETKLYPHSFDGNYDPNLPSINLVQKNDGKKIVKNVLCTAFGFGGSNAAIVLGGI